MAYCQLSREETDEDLESGQLSEGSDPSEEERTGDRDSEDDLARDLSKMVKWMKSLEELSKEQHFWGDEESEERNIDFNLRLVSLNEMKKKEEEESRLQKILDEFAANFPTQDWLKPRQRDFPPEIYSMLERLKKGGKPVYKLADEAWKTTLNEIKVSTFVKYVNQLQVQRNGEGLLSFLKSLTIEVDDKELLTFLRKALKKGDFGEHNEVIRKVQDSDWDLHLVESHTTNLYDMAMKLPKEDFKEARDELMRFTITHDQYLGQWWCEGFCKWLANVKQKIWRKNRDMQKRLGFHRIALRVDFSISPAKRLLMCNDYQLAVMLRELTNTGSDSEVFSTTFACALVLAAKARVRHHFKYVILNDLMFIILLGFVGYAVRSETMPGTLTVLFMGISTAFLLRKAFDRLMFYATTWKKITTPAVKTSLYTVALISVEVGSTILVILYILGIVSNEVNNHGQQFESWEEFWKRRKECMWPWTNKAHKEDGYFQHHPNLLALLILCRWAMFINSLQLIESVGRNVVPLAHAVTRAASLIFLLFLTCSLLATFHAYFVFPLHQEASFDTALDRLIDMFRLEMLSDFDLDELQNRRQNVSGDISAAHLEFTGSMWHAGQRQYQGIRVGFVLISLFLSVVAMNTYIGLLGELYSEAVKKKNQIYNNYLATVLWPHLSMRHRSNKWYSDKTGWMCSCSPCAEEHEDEEPLKGVEACWMFYDRTDLFDDPDEKTREEPRDVSSPRRRSQR
ncbi:Uncharacterized protein SCF082_LOCUS34971 [Durusdinium trenchii]|uniref:Ion transport domain-containing protein n=1 Tax=Durusdinium trenchii TaxID=1381693 RepID=A0ABP0P5K8_9DINO